MTGLCYRAPLGAILLVALAATPALAGKAVTSAAMSLREGPGESYTELAHISAGSLVDLRECNTRQWCHVFYRQLEGWVHVRGVEQANHRGGGGGQNAIDIADGNSGGANGDGSSAGGGSTGGGSGRSRPSGGGSSGGGGGNTGMSSIDAVTLPTGGSSSSGGSGGGDSSGGSSGGTPGDRLSQSGSGTSSDDKPPGLYKP